MPKQPKKQRGSSVRQPRQQGESFDKLVVWMTPFFVLVMRFDGFIYRRHGWNWILKVKDWKDGDSTTLS
jgi:hypothetical protein